MNAFLLLPPPESHPCQKLKPQGLESQLPGEKIEIKTEVIPPQRWRNLWHTRVRYRNCINGEWVGPGEYWGAYTWPTKEKAEEIAREDMALYEASKRANDDVYIGAFPVSD